MSTQPLIGTGMAVVALVASEVVTGWARAASAVLGALILVVTLSSGIVKLRREMRKDSK